MESIAGHKSATSMRQRTGVNPDAAAPRHYRMSGITGHNAGILIRQRCRVSAGGFHQLSLRPSMYLTGAPMSSAGSALSRAANLIET